MAQEVNTQVIVAWVQLAQQLAVLGINAANGIKNAVKALQPDVTDSELNAIIQATKDDASRRKALAEADAAGLGQQPLARATTAQPAAASSGVAGKLSPTGHPLPGPISNPLASPPSGAGPTGTDGITGTKTANTAPPAPAGAHGAHSHVDRPAGGLPGTASALPEGNSPFAAEAETGTSGQTSDASGNKK